MVVSVASKKVETPDEGLFSISFVVALISVSLVAIGRRQTL
jgi:hypothetical protein